MTPEGIAVERYNVLIVDDEQNVRDSLRLLLKDDFNVITAGNGDEALELLEHTDVDLMLLDVMMPNRDGLETLEALRASDHTLPVIMLSANNTVKTAVAAMKLGALDYLSKPFEVEGIKTLINSLLSKKWSGPGTHTNSTRANLVIPPGDFGPLVGSGNAMEAVFGRVEQVAARDTTVLITGESGTGKELIAHQIHNLSNRKDKAFVPINCAAIPESLIESELFGHEKGAFTNAIERRLGYFELADGGTIFLDEIGELSLPVQVKILRFLQEHEFCRVGDSRPIHVDVRIIVATNQDLEELIDQQRFRQDLYYRINVINITMPALRDRFEDIMPLAEHFVEKYSPMYGNRKLTFSKAAYRRLVEYSWPGNVRELENVVESLMALTTENQIEEADLPPKFHRGRVEQIGPNIFDGSMSFEEAERVFEKEMIIKALRKSDNVQTRAAELLGISRRILKYKMDKLGITDSSVEQSQG